MHLTFDEKRTTQAAAVLINLDGGGMSSPKLTALLYLADREHFQASGTPITGACYYNSPKGPMLREVLHCLRGSYGHDFWAKHIRRDRYLAVLVALPGDSELSDFDVDVLTRLFKKYERADYTEIVSVLQSLPEWRDPGATLRVLHPEEILRALGYSEGEVTAIVAENDYHHTFEATLRRGRRASP